MRLKKEAKKFVAVIFPDLRRLNPEEIANDSIS